MAPGAPPNSTRKLNLLAAIVGLGTSATRCVFVPLARLPSAVAYTFAESPLVMLFGLVVLL